MNTQQLLNEILPILNSVKEDKEKLQQILDFLLEEIYTEPEDEEIEITEKYRELVHSVAQNIDCGLVCFINPDTLEVENIPKSMIDDPFEFNLSTGINRENEIFLHEEWETYISIEPRESSESFGIMEKFVGKVKDKKLRTQLIDALNNRRPFAHFKNIVESSNYRKEWFAFKQSQLEMMVWEELRIELENFENNITPYREDINGFYNDDGTKIDPDSVPVPGLCVICKSHQTEDWEENLLCLMNRNDQRDEPDFKCGAFEKI
jgi:hypothetical protein